MKLVETNVVRMEIFHQSFTVLLQSPNHLTITPSTVVLFLSLVNHFHEFFGCPEYMLTLLERTTTFTAWYCFIPAWLHHPGTTLGFTKYGL